MNHLSVDELTSFISVTKIDPDSLAFLAEVNGHLRVCRECRKKVNAFQCVHDGLTGRQQMSSESAVCKKNGELKHTL